MHSRSIVLIIYFRSTSINRIDIVGNSDYERLCRSLKRNARHLELNDVIEALKIISYVGTSASSEITMSLLNLIKYQINDVTLGKLVSGSLRLPVKWSLTIGHFYLQVT